jgi:serine/threonine protein kinase/tetratricopeptide (TPR) repeat protein
MTEHAKDAEAIFLAALDKATPPERAAYVEEACAGRRELLQRVRELLGCHEEAQGPLDAPPPGLGPPVDESPTSERPGSQIGPYKLLEQIGEGGFGVVFMAEQTRPVRRKVALKLIKPGMDSKQVIARFEVERQALALMDHPNIAHVLDAGATASGQPYFVMELVRGVPVTRFCDANRLTSQQRLELFVSVCQAVQHAHTKGIIHRDLKPGNVLVTLHDGTPVAKVIDFGIAKAMGQPLTDKTQFTGFAQLLGTPLYMSPEQAEMSGLDVDTRSDIYSLGVLLYELLTGTTPFDSERLRAAGYDEMRRILREEEPARPSLRVSTLGEPLTGVSAQRQTDPKRLSQLFRGEVDWIVMKALEKDRGRRYETASAFAADVKRYLQDEPVLACPPSVRYRLRKFVRRNKGPVLAATLFVLALVGGIIGTTWGMIRAEQARRNAVSAQSAEAERAEGERRAKEEAEKRLAQIEQGTETLASVIRDLDPMAAEKEGVTWRALLGKRLGEAAQQFEGEAVGDPLVVARLQQVLGVTLRELGHLEQAQVVFVKACQTRERLLGADHLDTVATKHHLALLYREQGKYAQAETLHMEVVAVRTAKLGADNPDTLTSRHHLALLYHSQEKYALAETLFKEVVAVRTAKLGADHPDTLTSQHRLAQLYRSQGKYALAETLFKEVLAIRTATLTADHLDTVATKHNLAALYLAQRNYALAETLFKEVLAVRTAKLGPDHPDSLTSRHHLALLYESQGKHALAETLFKEVLAVRTTKLGADHPDTLISQHDLAALYRKQGKNAPAETLYKEVLAIRTAKLGADHPETLISQHHLALLYRSMKKLDQSIPLLEEILNLRKAKLGPDHPDTLDVQADLGVLYCDAGRFADAIPLLEEVHRKDPDLAIVGNALLTAYLRTGKTGEGTALATEQVQAARRQFPADDPQLAAALADTGKALLDAKAYAAAELLLRESLSLGEQKVPDAWQTHHARSLLGGTLLGQQKYADAEPLLLQGYTGLKERAVKIPPEEQGSLTTAVERLAQLYDAWDKPGEAAKWRKELEKRKE